MKKNSLHSLTTKEKMRKSHIGLKPSLGKCWKLSEEAKRKHSLVMVGKRWKMSDVGKINISNAQKGKKKSKESIIKRGNSNRGKKRSKETIERIRKARTGTRRLEVTKKKISQSLMGHPATSGSTGLTPSIETRKKMSEAHKGEKCHLWRGGITSVNDKIRKGIEFRLWREAVFARDNWTCQKCKVKGVYLHSHHVLNFSKYIELRFAIDNGITFCKQCHNKFHKIYSKGNNTREQLEKFLNII